MQVSIILWRWLILDTKSLVGNPWYPVKLQSYMRKSKQSSFPSIDSASSVVLTSDMWAARTTEAYLTVTGHFINQNWQMQACTMETMHVAVQHIADKISELLTKISDEWGITNKVRVVITDNSANMVSAVRKINRKHIPCFSPHPKLSCEIHVKADICLESILD